MGSCRTAQLAFHFYKLIGKKNVGDFTLKKNKKRFGASHEKTKDLLTWGPQGWKATFSWAAHFRNHMGSLDVHRPNPNTFPPLFTLPAWLLEAFEFAKSLCPPSEWIIPPQSSPQSCRIEIRCSLLPQALSKCWASGWI